MHDLAVGDVMPTVSRTIRCSRDLNRVERVDECLVADRVKVHLETESIEPRDDARQRIGGQERDASTAVAIAVRVDHRRRPHLDDAVKHDLHRVGAEPANRSLPHFD